MGERSHVSCAVEALVKEVDLAGTTAEGDPCLEVRSAPRNCQKPQHT